MKYGVLGDIHGNYDALEAVIADTENEKVDKLLNIGDIVGYGAEPSKCIETLRRLNCFSVAGNHDYGTAGKRSLDSFNDDARKSVIWTREHLSNEEIDYLANLPVTLEEHDYILVHGTLHHPELFGYVANYRDAENCFWGMHSRICFLGHTHIPLTFSCGEVLNYFTERRISLKDADKFIVNVGSVGQPRDRNTKAAYAIYDTEEQIVRIRRLDYDVERAAEKMRLSGLPVMNADRLKIGW